MRQAAHQPTTIFVGATLCVVTVFSAGFARGERAPVPEPTMSEFADFNALNDWLEAHFSLPDSVPFSFRYGGEESRQFLSSWKYSATEKALDATRTQRVP